jgi:VCBS repeat-containing protein
MKTLRKSRTTDRRRQYQRRNFLRLERLEDRTVLSGASPVAVNDLYQSLIDQPLDVSAPAGVLANDTDAEGDTLSASLFSGPANGTLDLNADGSFLYTPNAGFTGTDSFIYFANDGSTNSMLAAVTLQIDGNGAAPQAQDDSFNTPEDGVLNIGFSEGVLANDTDPDGDPLTATLVAGPTNGTLALNADGSFTYIPNADYTGSDSFTYTATDGAGVSNVATVNITIDPVNDLPTAENDAFTVDEDTDLALTDSILANDTDPDGDPLTATLVSSAQHGTLTLNSDGTFTYAPVENFNGLDGFSYLVSDAEGNSNVATVTITVNSVNDLPSAVNDEYSTDEDTPLAIAAPGLLGNDTDVEGDPLSAAMVAEPEHGTLTLNADGSFLYTPDENFNGTDGFSYLANDGSGDSLVASVTITVNPVNDAPVAGADSYSVDEDATLTIDAAAGVLANDTDIDGDPLTATLVTGPANGTLTLNSDGSFSYTPTANFNGSDSFTYSVSDGTTTVEATATITVNPVNDLPEAVNDEYSTDEDTPLTIAAPGILGNDTDVDGDPLSASIVNQPEHGTVTLNADGSFVYTPEADFNGVDGFSYLASDASGNSEVATVTITVNPVNDAPTGTADVYATDEDTALTIDAAGGVLANDLDADGDPLTATMVTGPANGTLTLNSDGSFVYTPNADFNGTDSFVYTASDGTVSTSDITVTINVNATNDAPVAVADAYSVDEDATLTIDAAAGLLANDTDVDGDALATTVVTGPASGTLTLNADGSFSYTPNADFNGTDTFTYSVSDGELSSEATVTITVNPVNDAPVAVADAYSVDEDATLTIDAAAGLLANDTDIEGDALTATVITGPASGTLTLNADGSFSYTPNADFNGTDTFTYSVSDGTLSSEATVTITVNPVNDAPVAVADTYDATEDTVLTIDAAAGVLANDTDADGDPLTATLVTGPANGTITLNSDGSFVYTPNADANGSDSFTYSVSDGTSTSEATVTINVAAANDAPVATADAYATDQDTALAIDAAAGVLANDTDPDGDPLSAILVTGPTNGTLTLNADGSFNYTPTTGFTGTDTFTYKANDGTLESETTVTITVNPVETAPEVVDDAYSTGEDVVLTADAEMGVLANDFDPEGGTLTAAIVTTTTHGTLTLNADGSFTYTPEANWNGTDTFVYEVSSSTGGSIEATASIIVEPLNDAPLAVDDVFGVLGTELSETVMANDSDIDGDELTARLIRGPEHGELVFNDDGTFTYTADAGFTGEDCFRYQLNDGMANSRVAQVKLNVGPVTSNIAPFSIEDAYTVTTGQTLTEAAPGVLANDTDADGDPMTATLVDNATHGALTLNADGSFSYTPEAGFTGSDTFTYMANDGTEDGNVVTVTLTVTPEGTGTPIEAADDSYSVDAETVLTIDAAAGVLANDVDAEGDPLTVTVVDDPANGTVALAADGSFGYTPHAGFSGSDTFTYQATDGTNVSNAATVTIEVEAAAENTRPSAGNDSYTVDSGAVLEVPADQGVLLDDSDPEGDAITASLFSGPLHGTVTLNENGSFTYTPNAGYVGLDSFMYRVFDGALYSALAAVTIHVVEADPGEIPPPDDDDCGDMSMSMLAMGEGEDDGLLDSLVDPSLDSDTLDDVLADGSWLT